MVARWLQEQGWEVLHRRWRCRWGELDIIARSGVEGLIFVEVKTRSAGNWDSGGLEAIAPSKQAKLRRAAEVFLSERPELAELPCRFDVAVVARDRLVRDGGCQFALQAYIASAFD